MPRAVRLAGATAGTADSALWGTPDVSHARMNESFLSVDAADRDLVQSRCVRPGYIALHEGCPSPAASFAFCLSIADSPCCSTGDAAPLAE